MSDIAEDLRTLLLADATIASVVSNRVSQNRVPQTVTGSFIFFIRSSSDDDSEMTLQHAGGDYAYREFFDVEAIGTIGNVATLSKRLKRLNGHVGAVGNGSVQALFVRDQADDYVPYNVLDQSDSGPHLAAVRMELVGYSET